MIADVVIGLQFGSEGKGMLCAKLAKSKAYDAAVCAWGPNSGHTVIDGPLDKKYIHRMLPCSSKYVKKIFIGPAAVIDLDLLKKDISHLISDQVVFIHENAMILQPKHRDSESDFTSIGSTRQGTGAAAIEKISRSSDVVTAGSIKNAFPRWLVVSHSTYLNELMSCNKVLVEGSQGYSLGINSGFYPYVTSRECTVAQVCSDTLVPIKSIKDIYGVARLYPIRVGGTSGPGYSDQTELIWEQVGVKPEITSVTNRERRVFSFSKDQFIQAIKANSCNKVFINFINYENVNIRNAIVQTVHDIACSVGASVVFAGVGPKVSDIREVKLLV